MDYRTAEKILREVHLRRDWSLHWFQAGADNTMLCNIRGWVLDSGDYPRYQQKSLATGQFVVRLDEVHSPQELLRIVMDNLCLMGIHEEREFMRFGPQWLAPFHPHRPDGQKLWVATGPKSILAAAGAHPVITTREA